MLLNEKKKEKDFLEASNQIGRQKNVWKILEVDRVKETPVTHQRQTESEDSEDGFIDKELKYDYEKRYKV